jgi:hypothetical protein
MNVNIASVKALYTNPEFLVLLAVLELAQEESARLRALVDAYSQPILDKAGLVDDEGNPITDLRRAWLCQDGDACDAYYAARLQANNDNGFDLGDSCPALVAESSVTDAENALIAAANTHYGLPTIYNLDLRAKYLDLLTNPPRH